MKEKTKEESNEFFDYNNKLREKVDRKVYREMSDYAEIALKKGKNVILDAGHFFKWQRKNIYEKAIPLDADIFIIRVICGDEIEIKRRLEKRSENFGASPFDETPSWNTYLTTKEIIEPPEKDILTEKTDLNIIEYDSLAKNVRFIQGNKNLEANKKIINAIKKTK